MIAIVHNIPIHYKHLLFKELRQRGVDFEVLFVAASSSARIEKIELSQSVYQYRIGYEGRYEEAPRIKSALYVWQALNDLDPEVVMISGWCDAAAWTAWAWSRLHRRRRILWMESNEFDHPRTAWKEAIKRWFVGAFDCAHVYGTNNRNYLIKLGMHYSLIHIKRCVVDVQRYIDADDIEPSSRSIVLLYVGRLSAEKNLEFLIRSFAAVKQDRGTPRLILAFVGYGPLEASLRSQALELGIEDLIQFWGAAHQREMPAMYRRADALVLPSVSEPWGLVVLEGMCSGLPSIVSDRCGCAIDVVRPETGWIFSPFDGVALTCLMDRISHMRRDELRAMGASARSLASQYSPEHCTEIVLESIQHVIRKAKHAKETR